LIRASCLPKGGPRSPSVTLQPGELPEFAGKVNEKTLFKYVLGDLVYGWLLGMERHMLHARQLGFTHPKSGKRLVYHSSPR
jgi:hypothetical protein